MFATPSSSPSRIPAPLTSPTERILRLRPNLHAPPRKHRPPLRNLANYPPRHLSRLLHLNHRHRNPNPQLHHRHKHPLNPFHNSTTGTFWTSASVRTTTVFGYTYPETAEKNATYSIQYVNRLYGSSVGTPANQTTTSRSKRDGEQQPGVYTEWITNIRVAQNALDSTFTIYIFLGEFSSDPNAWLTEKSVVGSHTVFMPFSSDTQQNADIIVAGTVPLTKELNLNAKGLGIILLGMLRVWRSI